MPNGHDRSKHSMFVFIGASNHTENERNKNDLALFFWNPHFKSCSGYPASYARFTWRRFCLMPCYRLDLKKDS